MKVLLVDDNSLFLEGLKHTLPAHGFEVVGFATNGRAALARTRELHPDVVLMDTRMPICNGLEGTRLIKAEMPEVQVVMLTSTEDDPDLFEAIRSGAAGYLLKTMKVKEFVELLSGLQHGAAVLSPEMASRIIDKDINQSHQAGEPAEDGADASNRITILNHLHLRHRAHVIALAARKWVSNDKGI